MKPFVVYYHGTQSHDAPTIIYLGADKAVAFDKLIDFLEDNCRKLGSGHIHFQLEQDTADDLPQEAVK